MNDTTHASAALVRTPKASGYLQQLCKHFGHKLPVGFDERAGRIEFPMGVCTLAAAPDAGTLALHASAASAEDLARLEDVVARHLVRFAFREELEVTWSAA
jgi:hypothetical protein